MKTRRIFALMATILLLLTIFSACSNGPKVIIRDHEKATDNSTTLTFFGYKADDINLIAIEHALHAYMKERPNVAVNYESIKGEAYYNALKLRYTTDLANGFQNHILDDVFMLDQARFLSMGDDLAELQTVIDVDMYSDFVKSQIVMEGGVIKVIPMNLSSFGMYVNRTLLEKDGQVIPENLEQFTQVCNWYVSQGITPIICNFGNSLRSVVEACSFYGKTLDIDALNANPVAFADILRPGIQFVQGMIDSQWIDPAEVLKTKATSMDIAAFVKGETPFMITGGWVSTKIWDEFKSGTQAFDFGLYPFPVVEDGSVLVVDINTLVSVNAHSKNLNEALTFAAHFVNPDSIWEYCETQSCFSPLKNETRLPSDPSVAPTAPYYKNGRAVIGADFRLNVPVNDILTTCIKMMLDVKLNFGVEEAMQYITNRLNGQSA